MDTSKVDPVPSLLIDIDCSRMWVWGHSVESLKRLILEGSHMTNTHTLEEGIPIVVRHTQMKTSNSNVIIGIIRMVIGDEGLNVITMDDH